MDGDPLGDSQEAHTSLEIYNPPTSVVLHLVAHELLLDTNQREEQILRAISDGCHEESYRCVQSLASVPPTRAAHLLHTSALQKILVCHTTDKVRRRKRRSHAAGDTAVDTY